MISAASTSLAEACVRRRGNVSDLPRSRGPHRPGHRRLQRHRAGHCPGAAAARCARFRAAQEKLRNIDLLVHSAGIYNAGPIATISAAGLEAMFRVNAFSAFYLVRELLPLGLRNVVFIGSTAGQRGEPGHSHYAASKGAVQSMMMSIAVELAPRVRVNLVSPGWVRTPMAEESLQRIGPALIPTLPNRRVAEVDDVVNAALWLSSDASSHCIGQDLCVSGGALLVVPRGQVKPV